MALAPRMDRMPLGRFHWKMLLIVGLGSSFRSMNVGIVAYVLAALITDWKLDSAAAGTIGSVGVAGMVLGVALVGILSDRFGRKTMFEVTFLAFVIAAALCGIAWDLLSLLFFRFVAGIGHGGGSPPALTLVSELSPSRHRGGMMLILEMFWVTGSTLAALVAYLVIPHFGWRMAFLMGAIPAVYLVFVHKFLPESPRFFLDKGRRVEAEETIRRIERECGVEPSGTLPSLASNGAPRVHTPRARLTELFEGEYLKRTICLWLLWTAISYTYYGIFLWLPTLVVSAGYSMGDSFQLMLIITSAQIPGCVLAAVLVDRIGRKRTLVPYLLMCGVASYLFGLSTSSGNILVWGSLISFFLLGAWGIMTAFTAELYPTRLRSTGVGWAGAFGRMAGISSPMVTGWVVTQTGGEYGAVFLIFAAILILGGLNVAFLGEETAGQSLERLSA